MGELAIMQVLGFALCQLGFARLNFSEILRPRSLGTSEALAEFSSGANVDFLF